MIPEHIALCQLKRVKESETYSKWTEYCEWIENNIKIRRCRTYRPSNEKDTCCECGSPESDHVPASTSNSERFPTNAYGGLKFKTHKGCDVAEYVRVDKETEQEIMLELMTKVWEMKKPNLLISVAGGAAFCHVKRRLIDSFKRNLMKAAISTDTWIITGGTHCGVMKYAGEAVKEHRLTHGNHESVIVIGIAPWGIIHNRHVLENNKLSMPATYPIEKKLTKVETSLDQNHRYFILVDDGTLQNFGTEIPFRAKLERKISNMRAPPRDDRISLGSILSAVPRVILVLGGGLYALEIVQQALNENTPAVIMKGSGGAADILAYALKHARTVEVYEDDIKIRTEKEINPEVAAVIRKKMEDIDFCQQDEIGANFHRIMACIDKSYLIQIFKWNSDNGEEDLGMAILKALLKANNNQVRDKTQVRDNTQQQNDNSQLIDCLGLALVWNMFDIAKSEIFTENQVWENGSLDSIMLLAIWMNRAKFVELFYDKGITFKKFLNTQKLLQLYNQVSSPSLLKDLFKKMSQKKNEEGCNLKNNKSITFEDVGQLIQYLLGDSYNVDTFYKSNQSKEQEDAINPERELLIWSVLNNHQETAELFWRLGQDPIAAALVASALYSAMSHQTVDKESKEQFTENANKFTDLANGVLKECNRTDKKTTQRLLLRVVKNWGETSCIMIAIKAKNIEFISQKECQDLFMSIWNGTPMIKGRSNQPPDKNKSDTNDGVGNGTKNKVKCSSFRKTPVTAFYFHMISAIIFFGLYSFILISKLEEKRSVEEIILIVWVITLFLEEIRQAYSIADGKRKLRTYIHNGWNKLDVITILLFAIGMILRAIPYPQVLEAARVVLSVNLVTFFTRQMHMFCVHKEFGLKLVMILHTLKSIAYFVVILMAFTVSYAIASHAILYPNTELTVDNFIAIFRRPYWNIYGDLMLDEIEGDVDCSRDAELYRNGTHSRCPTESGKYFGPVLMVAYMLMSNTLLLNLLIVMLGDEYDKVKNNVDMYSNLQLLSLIDEYYSRPIVPPPFSVIVYVYWFIKRRRHGEPQKRAFVEDIGNEDEKQTVCQFEKETAEKFHYKRTPGGQNDKQSKDVRVKKLVAKMDMLQNQQQKVTETLDDLLKGQKRLEEQMKKQMELIEPSFRLPRRVMEVNDS